MAKSKQSRSVTCAIDMRFAHKNIDQALRLLVSAIGRTEAKPGCLECMATRDATEEDRVRYSEEWRSKAAFQRHLRSEEFQRVLVAMDMCIEEPKVVVGYRSGRSGMAHLRAMREDLGGSNNKSEGDGI